MRIRSILLVTLAAGTVALGGLAGATAASAAPATTSGPVRHVDRLGDMSCKGSSFCMAVGTVSQPGHGTRRLIEVWNGTSWRVIGDPIRGVPIFVRCGSPTFCLVGLSATRKIEVWNGKTWGIMRQQPPSLRFDCGGSPICVAVHGTELSRWNGVRWQVQAHTDACAGAQNRNCGWNGISCGSRTNCLAMGHACADKACSTGPAEFSMFWNGKTWARSPAPFNPFSLSCAGASFCMSADISGHAAVFDGHSWTDVSPDLSTACGGSPDCMLIGESCGAARSCMFGANVNGSLFWNGTTWTFRKFALVGGKVPDLETLSCGAAKSCMILGTYPGNTRRTIAEHWNGTSWQVSQTRNP